MNITEQTQAALKDPSNITESLNTETNSELSESVTTLITKLVADNYLNKYVESLVGEIATPTKPKDLELFQRMQEHAVNHYGDINTESMSLAVASYLTNGGEFDEVEIPEIPVTFKELYNLEDSDELVSTESTLSTAARKALPDSAFCGPNRAFPVHNKAHAVAAMRLIGRYKGSDKSSIESCIRRRAKQFGVGSSESGELIWFPIIVETDAATLSPYSITNSNELEQFVANLDSINESYKFSEDQRSQLSKFVEEIQTNIELLTNTDPLLEYKDSDNKPIELSNEYLAQFFIESESQTEYLRPLVGLVRTKRIKQDEIEESSSKYQVFGSSVLKVLLAKGFNENEVIESSVIETTPSAPVSESTSIESEEELDKLFSVMVHKTSKGKPKSKDNK